MRAIDADVEVAEMIREIALDVLDRIDDPDVRFEFFRRFVTLARETVPELRAGHLPSSFN